MGMRELCDCSRFQCIDCLVVCKYALQNFLKVGIMTMNLKFRVENAKLVQDSNLGVKILLSTTVHVLIVISDVKKIHS